MDPIKLRNFLFKAFIINYLFILVFWFIASTGAYYYLMFTFFMFTPEASFFYLALMIGGWKILACTFFLIPAIALHWEFAGRDSKKIR